MSSQPPLRGKPLAFVKESRRTFRAPPAGYKAYGWAYRHSAQVLYAALPQREEPQDVLVASPMIFLYRHSVEACIAAIVCGFGQEVGTSVQEAKNRKHDIRQHIPDLKKLAALAGIELDGRALTALEQLAAEDPRGLVFRFPGKHTWGKETFNLSHFVFECEMLLDELDSVLAALENDEWRKVLDELDESDDPGEKVCST